MQTCMPPSWPEFWCDIERTRQKWPASLASLGMSSHIWMPGTFVAIGLNGPRISWGGVWLQIQAVDVAGAAVLNDENTRFARCRPRPRAGPGRAGPEQVRQSQPQEADAAHLEELPTAEQAVRTPGCFVD